MNATTKPVVLPYPPSANRYWRKTRAGGIYTAPEAVAYRQTAATSARSQGMKLLKDCTVSMTLHFYRPWRRGDLSNFIKILEDALQGIGYVNDSQVTALDARRFEDKDNPRVEVWLTPARDGEEVGR